MVQQKVYGLPKSVIDQINAVFKQYPAIQKVIIYGSRAKGNFRTGSDIDLCIEAINLDLSNRFKIENQLDDLLLPWKIDLVLKHQIDNPLLLEHINSFGHMFYP